MIVEAIGPPSSCSSTTCVRFAEEAAARVRRDHELFGADHRLGAFTSIDVAYD